MHDKDDHQAYMDAYVDSYQPWPEQGLGQGQREMYMQLFWKLNFFALVKTNPIKSKYLEPKHLLNPVNDALSFSTEMPSSPLPQDVQCVAVISGHSVSGLWEEFKYDFATGLFQYAKPILLERVRLFSIDECVTKPDKAFIERYPSISPANLQAIYRMFGITSHGVHDAEWNGIPISANIDNLNEICRGVNIYFGFCGEPEGYMSGPCTSTDNHDTWKLQKKVMLQDEKVWDRAACGLRSNINPND